MDTIITSRCPIIEVDGSLVALVIGSPEAEFGDGVVLDAHLDGKRFSGIFVAGVDTAPTNEVGPELLHLFGYESTDALHSALVRHYGTALPVDAPVTVYTLIDKPVEETLSEDELLDADDEDEESV